MTSGASGGRSVTEGAGVALSCCLLSPSAGPRTVGGTSGRGGG